MANSDGLARWTIAGLIACVLGCATAPTPTLPREGRALAVTAGKWFDAQLVFALHEPGSNMTDEDEHHPRVMAFADGRVLYRVREAERWQWYLARHERADIERWRLALLADLAGVPPAFSCFRATHQRFSMIVVKDRADWRLHEVQALDVCGVVPPFPSPGAFSAAADERPNLDVPPGFVTAYRRIVDEVGHRDAKSKPWHTPKLMLRWSEDSWSKSGPAWPRELPRPTMLPTASGNADFALDGEADHAVRTLLHDQVGTYRLDGKLWFVEVHREHPGEEAVQEAIERAYKTQDVAWNLECRASMRELGECIVDKKLDTPDDRACILLTEAARTSDDCEQIVEDAAACLHAVESGCDPDA